MPHSSFSRQASRAGFTLLELMVVLVIISILAGAFIVTGGKMFQDSARKETAVRLTQLAAMVEQFAQIEGDYPDDRLPKSLSANAVNTGSEALVLAFFAPGYTGSKPSQAWLGNTDDDSSQKKLTTFAGQELFEITDVWGNPVYYAESLHYSRQATLMAGPDELFEEQFVDALRNETTGDWQQPNRFQLISAGMDGFFGTEDDITHSR
ncbi:MAG: prepilin-type N-terminal cleavage/methylation domain-containing protein [Planctomycetes bacterium]|jgi:prepilin-type N-terminal cleavage/methylation domain-containing protein|nr:prepilin-type N-terminal cleavage/methylation domain-containing protein [Planctomycetota bacterium]MBT4028131.1 prepilin-type N-terminal cleavage/methylation domain-containing protein [Planctomycetota bacterium]MBT4560744.1 prepilin-type N-terminal cleavage/methylation domain-containing protein [Planctomycetota bacterium]MBT5121091.1 prepilin-type N-terminal cleavage/methylation domain-containing protein [Planctomycetota bacterium]MBT7012415.1 prepilin-type N-terminal cleavage/methylation do